MAASRDKAKFASIQAQKNLKEEASTTSNTALRPQLPAKGKGNTKGLLRLYLFAYNISSLSAWSYILFRLFSHLSSPTSSLSLTSLLLSGKHDYKALLARSETSYADFGDLTRVVQTTALLEVVHVALGLVRSGLGTTVAQVASRLVLVWGVLLQFPQVQTSPIFTSMVFAWCIAEMVRYSTYALALYNVKIYPLEWLRYTLFYILYPLGAGSEAYLIYSSIPWARYRYGQPGQIVMMVLFLIWPPALLTLMSHMHAQRRKHIGKGRTSFKGKKVA